MFKKAFTKFNSCLINTPENSIKELETKFKLDEKLYFLAEVLNRTWRGVTLLDTELFEVILFFILIFIFIYINYCFVKLSARKFWRTVVFENFGF